MKTEKRILIVALTVLAGVLAFCAFVFFGFSTPCPSKVLFHFDCAGCGATRMFTALTKGQIYQAFRFNPLVFILLPFLAAAAVYSAVVFIKGKPNILLNREFIWVYIILIILAVAFTVLRNIPMFSYLAPTVV